jgi:hypothetical protein
MFFKIPIFHFKDMSSKPKRIRAGNFSAEEKEMTLAFVQEHSVVLESKTADPNIFKKKRRSCGKNWRRK